eukprot:578077-Rhodomonas_salina.1
MFLPVTLLTSYPPKTQRHNSPERKGDKSSEVAPTISPDHTMLRSVLAVALVGAASAFMPSTGMLPKT